MFPSPNQVFLVLYLAAACHGSCPIRCSCTPFGSSRVKVKCIDVKKVPRGLPFNTILLDLSNNSLKIIPKDSFRNLTSLKAINLNGNRIREGFYLPESVVRIEMRGNLLSSRALKIILKGITRLGYLDVSNNSIGPNLTSDVFSGLHDIVYLQMEGCHLENIESGTFKAMKKLSCLNLSWNRLPHIERETLEGAGYLIDLDLAHNLLISVPGLSGLTNIVNLDLAHNLLTSVPDLSGLTNIVNLKLDGNHIKNIIQLGAAFHIKWLYILSLANNQIDNLPASVFQTKLSVVKYIDLAFNKLQSLPDKAFSACGDLQELLLHFNKISYISRHTFTGLVNLTRLFLHGNAIKHIDGKGFHNLPNLHILTLFSNPPMILQAGLFDGLKSNARVFTTCQNIPQSPTGTSTVAIFCSPGSCSDRAEETCLKCPAGGLYQDEIGENERRYCSNGTYVSEERRPGNSATDCWACPYDLNRKPKSVDVIQCVPTVTSVKVPKETNPSLSTSSLCFFTARCC